MLDQVSDARELVFAVQTLVRLDASVDARVGDQTLAIGKFLEADAALKWCFLRVLSEVHFKLAVGEESLAAEFAAELLLSAVDEHVGGQSALGDEFGLAEVAGEFLLLAAL